jgi:RHS repeat-associated protein
VPAAATYLHRDGLSSVRAITDTAGVKIESALYRPFGEQSEWVLPGNAAPETKGWIGERYDADAGLQYLNARYYDPELSLFLQPDWFEVTKAGVGTNRFSYSFNDPVNKFDPGGSDACTAMSDCVNTDDNDIPGFSEFDPTENTDTVAMLAGGFFAGAAVVIEAPALALGLASRYPGTTNFVRESLYAEVTGVAFGGAALTKGKTAATELAKAATKRGANSGAAAAIETKTGEIVTGLSKNAAKRSGSERNVSPEIAELADESASLLGGAASGCFGRNCAEVGAVSKAIEQGLDLVGSKIYAAYVGTRQG